VTEGFAYLPFGGGRRKCIGDQFALFESVVALAMLLRRYEFELAPGKPEVGMTTGERSCRLESEEASVRATVQQQQQSGIRFHLSCCYCCLCFVEQ